MLLQTAIGSDGLSFAFAFFCSEAAYGSFLVATRLVSRAGQTALAVTSLGVTSAQAS